VFEDTEGCFEVPEDMRISKMKREEEPVAEVREYPDSLKNFAKLFAVVQVVFIVIYGERVKKALYYSSQCT